MPWHCNESVTMSTIKGCAMGTLRSHVGIHRSASATTSQRLQGSPSGCYKQPAASQKHFAFSGCGRAARMKSLVKAAAIPVGTASVVKLAEKFSIPGAVEVTENDKGLKKVVLTHSSGTSAEVYLLGACVTSWKQPSGDEVLYLRPDAKFDGSKPISGGIPHCFPQFGPGKLQQHGFARNLEWSLASTSADPQPDERDPEKNVIDDVARRATARYRLVHFCSFLIGRAAEVSRLSRELSFMDSNCFQQIKQMNHESQPSAVLCEIGERALDGDVQVTLVLEDSQETREMWPYKFKAVYSVSLHGEQLKTDMRVFNTGDKAFEFTAALHSYFEVKDISVAKVEGLKGLDFLDKVPDVNNPVNKKEEQEQVIFEGPVDSVYTKVPDRVALDVGTGAAIQIVSKGWQDVVVWNPHEAMPDCYRKFACVENAQFVSPVRLNPAEDWRAEQELTVIDL